MLAHTFELRCHNFPDFLSLLIFLAVFKASLAAVFGVFSLASSPLLVIVTRRLLYVPDYVVG